ncbi:aldo/keto reductase [Janthinobacterium sp. PC23-8]|uniref:aldo/keto reductase n=1 Tax=Janthinobacterium sp. PC23-8 TaxID=2012679 RepID=UPI0020CC7194|nr:aldo/keto reductase [Janthinobacterium sp. PC23-8]
MTADIAQLTLNDGQRLAQIGFGTWPLDDAQAQTAVQAALACCYRLIDTAARYGNGAGVGHGIAASGVACAEVQLTSKLPQ